MTEHFDISTPKEEDAEVISALLVRSIRELCVVDCERGGGQPSQISNNASVSLFAAEVKCPIS